MAAWEPRSQWRKDPIAIIGGGVLGRRLAIMWASRGATIHLCDSIEAVRLQAKEYFDEHAKEVQQPECQHGQLKLFDKMRDAVPGAWLIIEAIPERLSLKIDVFGQLDDIADSDAILATNSSSYKSSEMIAKVSRKERVLNIHAFMPPDHIPCEIMTCGHTDPAIVDFMVETTRLHGFKPFKVLKESSGFIYNRVWAAIKREALYSVAQGASTPEDLDDLFRTRLRTPLGPFQMMDNVGLDTVMDIECHYAHERSGLPEEPRQLLQSYIDRGYLGRKSGRGFYSYT